MGKPSWRFAQFRLPTWKLSSPSQCCCQSNWSHRASNVFQQPRSMMHLHLILCAHKETFLDRSVTENHGLYSIHLHWTEVKAKESEVQGSFKVYCGWLLVPENYFGWRIALISWRCQYQMDCSSGFNLHNSWAFQTHHKKSSYETLNPKKRGVVAPQNPQI